jgi:sugar phosphate isomerase/epimerase
MNTARLSLNQITLERLSLLDAVNACVRHGIGHIGVWRYKFAEAGFDAGMRCIRDAGLTVSSVCRGGMFPVGTASERQARIDDNLRAIDEAALLDSKLLVLVCGPAPDRDLTAARGMVEEGIGAIVNHARKAGVRLGIEPLHPMFVADRSVITSMREANALAAHFDAADVGIVIDTFHVWWDYELLDQIALARGRIVGFHVSDWLTPLPDILLGRGMMGDGVIDIPPISNAVAAAGYEGPVEVEIFNRAIWDSDPDEVLSTMCERFGALV